MAETLRDWLPLVIQAVEPWLSAEDIEKGSHWPTKLGRELEDSEFGIVCLTVENLAEPWILFEAGALSKTLNRSYVCPYLLDVKVAQLSGPLALFQATEATESDTRRLMDTMNSALKTRSLSSEQLKETFDKWWPGLADGLSSARSLPEPEGKSSLAPRGVRETLDEILRGIRTLERVLPEMPDRQSSVTASFLEALKQAGHSPSQHGTLGERFLRRCPECDGRLRAVEGTFMCPVCAWTSG